MTSPEQNIMKRIMLKLSMIPGCRMFRNNVAVGYTGNAKIIQHACTVNVNKGDILIYQGRILHAGLCKGSSDLIGLHTVTVTPQMVGKQVAIFTAVEVKTASGRASEEQINFINMVNKNGGIGFIARDENEAALLLNKK